MPLKPDHIECRICGMHFSSDVIASHALNCMVKSQENINVNDFTDKNKSVHAEDESDEHSSDSFYSFSDEDDDENHVLALPEGSRSISFQNNSHNFHEKFNPSNERKSSLVTETFRYDRQKPENLFPPTKKYRYYPVTCEYCNQRFQPDKLKAHQKKHHFGETDVVKPARRIQSTALRRGYEKKPSTSRAKSVGGFPRRLQVCYICGRLYGSKSLKIHEPKCLDKWRIQNDQLPPELRAPEPVKLEPLSSVATGKDGYNVPDFDPTVEAAFRSHLATLIPCRHCSRTFSPDRIQKHMSCCIERPRRRECATPPGGEIPR